MTLSGRSALPGTPWLLTLRVRSPGGSLWPTTASPPWPLAPRWSAQSAASPLLRDLLPGSLRPCAQGEPILPSQKGHVLHTHFCALGPLLPPGWDHILQSKRAASGGVQGLCLHPKGPPQAPERVSRMLDHQEPILRLLRCRDPSAQSSWLLCTPAAPSAGAQVPLCPKSEGSAWSWARLESPSHGSWGVDIVLRGQPCPSLAV